MPPSHHRRISTECNLSKNNDGKSNDESNKVANFTVAINNDSTESTYFVDRLRRQQQNQLQQQQQQQQQYQLQQYLQRTSRCRIQTLSSHIPSNAAKDIVEDELRNDLIYVHCATTEDEDVDDDDEEEEPKGLARSRSWLCCPGDRRSERTVPVHVEMDYTDKQHSLHAAALSSLRSEVADLNSRLLIATRAREAAEVALARAEVQAARAEQRAEQQAARHEERLTELHSVIAELGRQLERHRATVIAEEDESEIETSRDAEGSITNPVEESEGGGDIQGDGDRTLGDADSSCCEEIEHRTNENGREQLDSPAALPTPEPTQPAASCQSVAVATLQEEVTALRAEIVSLQAQLAQFKNQGQNGNQGQLNGDSPRREHKTRGNTSSPEPLTAPCSPLLPPLQTPPTKSVTREEPPVLKMAERVRLRRTDERHITGPDITNLGVCSTMVAEHLVSDLLEQSNLQELNGSEKQFEVETERLNSRLEHARANNAVLALTLHESKAQCDRLSLLVGKYESNAMALRLALSYSDRAIEAYDVLVALLESEIALSTERNSLTIDNRKAAENVAYHMLNRLENDCANVMGAPWEDSIILSDESEVTWTVENEERLRRHLSRLKGDRAMVRSTAVELESVHVEPLNSKNTISLAEARKLDLETAVLMQELMAMREDKAELRARVFLLEKERATIELKLNAQETQIAAQHAAIEHLQGQLNDTEAMLSMNKDRGLSDNESEGIESELIEALGREARLKERLQELVSTLDKVNKNSELRHQQSAELVNDLKKANSALVQTLEKTKKKYQSRLKKLEQQMLGMVERHTAQVKSLKQRIALLEEEAAVYKGTLPLQSQSSGASETSL
ncbi:colorectal mutant cancer protein-like isoform X4 [Vespa mandarinia]|uniref:colorectal mutant cancer protein-like isoform X4 n=1 Tax=Vespa mandarinia TaxID=7446 RepID=UPI0016079228|nr:colorectal mutant cancer protein-like isoform X4 [Vespa mandarinia]